VPAGRLLPLCNKQDNTSQPTPHRQLSNSVLISADSKTRRHSSVTNKNESKNYQNNLNYCVSHLIRLFPTEISVTTDRTAAENQSVFLNHTEIPPRLNENISKIKDN
jgi:hypothetical protein